MNNHDSQIIMYSSSFCGHSLIVERFLKKQGIAAKLINIDHDAEARSQVMALNNGYASVPTLIFPDGSHLTEPSFGDLRAKLGISNPGLMDRLRRLFGRASK